MARQERFLGNYSAGLSACVPDFLVVSAPKTGSTWLAYNLACHPSIFVPPDKEIKYFSNFHEWLDLDW
jgi:Sulfotransferase domain